MGSFDNLSFLKRRRHQSTRCIRNCFTLYLFDSQ